MTGSMPTARRMWMALEPVHALMYFAPESLEEATALGYPGDNRWPAYFAWRAAPLGAAGPHQVTAQFFSFSPAMVADHVPAVWATAAPQVVLASRVRATDRTWRTILGELTDGPGIAEAAGLARTAAEACDTAGRGLAAANRDLPWPDPPHLVLAHAATILREHRGDGHIAALLAAGLDGCEALVSFAATGAAPEKTFASRQWSDDDWQAARERLTARGWIAPDGTATSAGHEGRAAVEATTDALATGPWVALGEERTRRLGELMRPIIARVLATGLLPAVSTLGIKGVRPKPASPQR